MTRVRMRRWRWLAAVAALGLMAAACGDDDDTSGDAGTDSSADADGGDGGEAPQRGGEVVFVIQSDAQTLDPALNVNANSTAAPILSAIYGHLYTIDPETLEFVPGIAESLESEDDGTTWVLTLREGVQFSDGSPLDAEAVKFTWERMADPELRSPSAGVLREIAELNVVDATTLEVVLVEPNPTWVQRIPYQPMQWIVPPAAIEAKGEQFGNDPVGAGPFTIESRSQGSETVLVANPTYWDEGKPYIDRLVLRFSADGQQALDMVQAGQAHAFINPSDLMARRATDGGLEITQFQAAGGVNFTMNTRVAPFDDQRARQAVQLAVDSELINETVFEGAIEVPEAAIPASSPLASDDASFSKPDAERAQELFDELAAEGKAVSFSISTAQTQESQAMAEAIVTQLRAFDNVNVEIDVLDAAGYSRVAFVERSFQMINAGIISVDPEPIFWDWFHSTGGQNISGVESEAIDAALEAGRFATSIDERQQAYADFTTAVDEEALVVWTYRKYQAIAHSPDTGGWQIYGYGTPIYDDVTVSS